MFTDLQRKSPPRSAARRVRHLRFEPLETRLLLAFDVGFGDAVGYPVGENPEALTVADVDGDGVLDLVAANFADNTVSVLPGNGDGTFGLADDYDVGAGPISVVVSDFDGDGVVNAQDLGVIKAFFFLPPGPAGLLP